MISVQVIIIYCIQSELIEKNKLMDDQRSAFRTLIFLTFETLIISYILSNTTNCLLNKSISYKFLYFI